jgi:hypothetical protein
VQFTADQAYVDLLERARDLLWAPAASWGPRGAPAPGARGSGREAHWLASVPRCIRSPSRGRPVTRATTPQRGHNRATSKPPRQQRQRGAPAWSEVQDDAAPARVDSLYDAPARSVPADIQRDAPARVGSVGVAPHVGRHCGGRAPPLAARAKTRSERVCTGCSMHRRAPGTTGSFGCMSEADRRNAFPIVKTGC